MHAGAMLAITAERPDSYAPRRGDLICMYRGRRPVRYDELPTGRFASHCDIVVAARVALHVQVVLARNAAGKLVHTGYYAGDDLEAWAAQMREMLPGWMVYDFALMYRLFQEQGLGRLWINPAILREDKPQADGNAKRIAELEEKLVDQRQRFEAIGGNRAAEMNPADDPTTTVNVQADKGTSMNIIKRVLYTCEVAGYSRIRLAVGDAKKIEDAEGVAGEH